MTTTAESTAAPAELHIGGQVLTIRPMSDADQGAMDNWVRMRFVRIAREAMADAADWERREALAVAFEEASTLYWASEHGGRLAGTVEGLTRLVRQVSQSLDGRPATVAGADGRPMPLSDAWLREHLTPAAIEEFWDVFRLVNSGSLTVKKQTADGQ